MLHVRGLASRITQFACRGTGIVTRVAVPSRVLMLGSRDDPSNRVPMVRYGPAGAFFFVVSGLDRLVRPVQSIAPTGREDESISTRESEQCLSCPSYLVHMSSRRKRTRSDTDRALYATLSSAAEFRSLCALIAVSRFWCNHEASWESCDAFPGEYHWYRARQCACARCKFDGPQQKSHTYNSSFLERLARSASAVYPFCKVGT